MYVYKSSIVHTGDPSHLLQSQFRLNLNSRNFPQLSLICLKWKPQWLQSANPSLTKRYALAKPGFKQPLHTMPVPSSDSNTTGKKSVFYYRIQTQLTGNIRLIFKTKCCVWVKLALSTSQTEKVLCFLGNKSNKGKGHVDFKRHWKFNHKPGGRSH